MQRNRDVSQVSDSPEETIPWAGRAFKTVQLRLLMKEREDVVSRLAEFDHAIWALEEYFRAGNPS